MWLYVSKALYRYLLFHFAMFRKSLVLLYWEGIAAVWFCRSYSTLKVNFFPLFWEICPPCIEICNIFQCCWWVFVWLYFLRKLIYFFLKENLNK